MFDTLVNRILELGQQKPEKTAAIFKKEQLTFGAMAEKIRLIGSRLRGMGVQPGNRVLFTAQSKPEMIAVYLGIQYAGGIAVFMDKNGTAENAAFIYQDAEAVLFLTDRPMKKVPEEMRIVSLKEVWGTVEETLCELQIPMLSYVMPEEDSYAEILFTTGTTGTPKGVVLSYKSVYHILQNTIEGIGMRETDRVLIPLPLNHSFALRVLRAALYLGASVVLQNGFGFAREVENNQQEFGCTAMAAVPASMEILRSQMQDRFLPVLSKFRYIEVGAGSLTIEQRKRLTAGLPNTTIFNTWGSSETGGALFTNVTEIARDSRKVSAVGKPLPCVQVVTLDADGKPFDSDHDHPGRMALKGSMQMAGYWKRPELTAETLKDGWLLTSDMVYTDADGYVYMLGRADDIINVGGEKVSPIEVENAASEYEKIRECACIGAEDPEGVLGQIPVLFVVPADAGFTEAGMQTFLSGRMERYKLPQKYMILPEIPRNRMQKIDRRELRRLWENKGNASSGQMNPVLQAILTRRSIRNFTEEPVPGELLELILQAGISAPSGHNLQTWRFHVLQNRANIERLKELTQRICREKKVICYGFENPAVLILVSNDKRNENGCQDASCAAENMLLAAHSCGLGGVWLNPLRTICDEPEIRQLLTEWGVPETHFVWSMVALGYPRAAGKNLAKKKDVIVYVDERA